MTKTNLDLERVRIATMLRHDGRRFVFQIIGLMVVVMVAGAAIWEADMAIRCGHVRVGDTIEVNGLATRLDSSWTVK